MVDPSWGKVLNQTFAPFFCPVHGMRVALESPVTNTHSFVLCQMKFNNHTQITNQDLFLNINGIFNVINGLLIID